MTPIKFEENYSRCKKCSHILYFPYEHHYGFCAMCLVMLYMDKAEPHEIEYIMNKVDKTYRKLEGQTVLEVV